MRARSRIGLLAGTVVSVSAAAPTPAMAFPDPLGILPDALDPSKLAGKVLDQVFKWMFGDTPGGLAAKALKSLISNPDLQDGGLFHKLDPGVGQARPIALALLVFFFFTGFTFSLATDPTRGGLDVWKRLPVALAGIFVGPDLFRQFNEFIALASQAVISLPLVQGTVAEGLDAALGGGQTGAIFVGLAMIMLVALLAVKVVIVALLALLYMGLAFVMATFVEPRFSHLTGVFVQSTVLVQCVPIVWTLILLVFGLVGGGGALFDGLGMGASVVDIAVALALLAMLLTSLPFLMRMAWIGGLIPSMRGASTMAWRGASLAGGGGGQAFDAQAFGASAQAAMDDAAAPPRASGDRREAGPPMDFGAGSSTSTGAAPREVAGTAAAGPDGDGTTPAGMGALLSPGVLPAGASSSSPLGGTSGGAEGRAWSGGGSAAPPLTITGDDASTSGSSSVVVSLAAVADGGPSAEPAGEPLPAPASSPSSAQSGDGSAPSSATSTPMTASEMSGPARGDTNAAAVDSSESVVDQNATATAPVVLDGSDVRGASTAAPVDALDVPAPPAQRLASDSEEDRS